MNLHDKAKALKGCLQGEFLTSELLNERNELGETVLHLAARSWVRFRGIPVHVFTKDAMAQTDSNGNTVWHAAAFEDSLIEIPGDIFPIFPHRENIFNKKNNDGITVWQIIAKKSSLSDIPQWLITEDLLDIKADDGRKLFKSFEGYINKTILNRNANLKTFVKNYPEYEKSIEFKSSRLTLIDAYPESVYFLYEGIEEHILINDEGTFFKNVNHKTLFDAVSFIGKTYLGVEQNFAVPHKETLTVDDFTL